MRGSGAAAGGRAAALGGRRRAGPAARRDREPARASIPGGAAPASPPSAAAIAAIVVLLGCVTWTMTVPIYDADVWQHLLVGKVIWRLHRVPTTQLWTWPTYGAPDVNSSWGFRAIVWPAWALGGLWGLYTLRWALTITAFAFMWKTARRIGTRGLGASVMLVVCALTYRQRAQIRPEILVGLLIALEVWILETRRSGGPDRSIWLIPLAWTWANCHISYHFGLYVIGIHWLASTVGVSRRGTAPGRLIYVALAAVAVSFINPFGWRALAQPFDFFLHGRTEPIFRTNAELLRAPWSLVWHSGLGILIAAWAVLAARRVRHRGWDFVELAIMIPFAWLALSVNRFLGYFALLSLPYLARDLDDWVSSRDWPRWTAPHSLRAAMVAALGVALAVLIPRQSGPAVGIGFQWQAFPVRACDFIEVHGIRGRAFNHLNLGGYLLWRFWPDRGRLPFMDIHQAGTRMERDLYMASFNDRRAWNTLRDHYGIEWVLLWRKRAVRDHLLDHLDADTTFALVFVDDVAAVYVRRQGRLGAIADSFAYRVLPGGQERFAAIGATVQDDSVLRADFAAELRREVDASPYNAYAHSALANLDMIDFRWAEARADLARAAAGDPSIPWLHERMAVIALREGRPADAVRFLEDEHRVEPRDAGVLVKLGGAYRVLGQWDRAQRAYRRALELDPGDPQARAELGALDSLRGR